MFHGATHELPLPAEFRQTNGKPHIAETVYAVPGKANVVSHSTAASGIWQTTSAIEPLT